MNKLLKRVITLSIIVGAVIGFRAIPMTYHVTLDTGIDIPKYLDTSQIRDWTDSPLWAIHNAIEWATNQPLNIQRILMISDSNDTVIIHLNSPGGRVDVTFDVVRAMNNSESHIISRNEMMAASGAGIISFAADEIQASENSVYLFHRARYYTPFGGVVLAPNDSAGGLLVNEFLEREAFPYLTESEVRRYYNGEDVWIHGQTIIRRMNNAK